VRRIKRVPCDEPLLRKRIRALAKKYLRYGYRRIAHELRKEGWDVNVKRVHRLWKEEGLRVKRKTRGQRGIGPSDGVEHTAEHPGDVWCYDLIEDRT
jgi:putative transposase